MFQFCRESAERHFQLAFVLIARVEHRDAKPLLVGRDDDELMFTYNSFVMWIKRQKIPMSRFNGHFVLGDLRKFAEQYGDVIQWDQSNRAYALTHGVSGVAWEHYRNPLPENVYEIYMKYWRDIDIAK